MAPKNVLLLQGPVGKFFSRLATELRTRDANVIKVNFNAGDWFFFRGPDAISFRKPLSEWASYFRTLIEEKKIDTLFLTGDHRMVHKEIIPIARDLNVAVWVFEEGYLRPDHITLEQNGVNGNSSMSKEPDFYREYVDHHQDVEVKPVGKTFVPFAYQAVMYQCAMAVGAWYYPNYQHHRDARMFRQGFAWVRSLWRKTSYARKERGTLDRVIGEWSDRYFLVPLQLYCDFQIDHSDYEDIPAFIQNIVSVFAQHAPLDTHLLLKHHPLDRAYQDYTKLLNELGTRMGISERLHYVHDQHLPTLLKNARGVITMNSTVGVSALLHKTPVKVMGRAIYNVPELTYQGRLRSFFCDVCDVDSKLFWAFHRWMCAHNQFNGSFYKIVEGANPEGQICERLFADEPLSVEAKTRGRVTDRIGTAL